MAKISILLVAALAVAVVAEPIRHKRSDNVVVTAAGAGAGGSALGWDSHATLVSAIGIPAGQSGWGQDGSLGVPAAISLINNGATEIQQGASILEATSNTAEDLSAVQTVDVINAVESGDSLEVVASGGDLNLASSSDAVAIGSGDIAAAAEVLITSDGAASLGMNQQ